MGHVAPAHGDAKRGLDRPVIGWTASCGMARMSAARLLTRLGVVLGIGTLPTTGACGGQTTVPARADGHAASAGAAGATDDRAGRGGGAGTSGAAGASSSGAAGVASSATAGTGSTASGGAGVSGAGGAAATGIAGAGLSGVAGAASGVAGTAGASVPAGSSGAGAPPWDGSDGTGCLRAFPHDGLATSAQQCRRDADCAATGGYCLDAGRSGCSQPFGPSPRMCTSDPECAPLSGTICQWKGPREGICAPPCTGDAACGPAAACDLPSGHCTVRSCSDGVCPSGAVCLPEGVCGGADCGGPGLCSGSLCTPGSATCPPNFGCFVQPGQSPNGGVALCQRTPCDCDVECGAEGVCVGRVCHARAGRCISGNACGRPIFVGGAPLLAPLVAVRW